MVHIRHHHLILLSRVNQDLKEVRPLRDFIQNSPSIDQENMVLLLLKMTLIRLGLNKQLYIKQVIPCIKLEDRVCLTMIMIPNTDIARSKGEIIRTHKKVIHQNQAGPLRWQAKIL
jgi:hypothetical protein